MSAAPVTQQRAPRSRVRVQALAHVLQHGVAPPLRPAVGRSASISASTSPSAVMANSGGCSVYGTAGVGAGRCAGIFWLRGGLVPLPLVRAACRGSTRSASGAALELEPPDEPASRPRAAGGCTASSRRTVAAARRARALRVRVPAALRRRRLLPRQDRRAQARVPAEGRGPEGARAPARHELFGPTAAHARRGQPHRGRPRRARPARPALESGADASGGREEGGRARLGGARRGVALLAPPAAPAATPSRDRGGATAGDAPMATESAPVDEVESASAVDVAVESTEPLPETEAGRTTLRRAFGHDGRAGDRYDRGRRIHAAAAAAGSV